MYYDYENPSRLKLSPELRGPVRPRGGRVGGAVQPVVHGRAVGRRAGRRPVGRRRVAGRPRLLVLGQREPELAAQARAQVLPLPLRRGGLRVEYACKRCIHINTF